MNTTNRLARTPRGFTMIELLITTVIIGVVAALAVPSFERAYEKNTLRSGYRQLESTIKRARSYSIADKEPYGVHVDPVNRSFTLFRNDANQDLASFDLGSDSVLYVDTLPVQFNYIYPALVYNALVFNPNGSAQLDAAGGIFIAAETEHMSASFIMQVTPATGRVNTATHYYAW